MTMRITGSRRRAPWQAALRALMVAVIVFLICVILLSLTADFLVDWLWFSAVGYLGVFWTTIIAEAVIFGAVFIATSVILWAKGSLALRLAHCRSGDPADFQWKSTGPATLPDALEFARHRLPWRVITPVSACLLAVLVAWGEIDNWPIFLRFLHQVPYGASDPLYNKDIGFYLFTLPANITIKNWMLRT